ncbi:hypothetical protein SBADM41S_07572 [Streptomyces badius]
MTPPVGPVPLLQVRTEGDHARAARDDRARALPHRARVGRHRVGGQCHPAYPQGFCECAGKLRPQPLAQRGHPGGPDRHRRDLTRRSAVSSRGVAPALRRRGVRSPVQQLPGGGQQLIQQMPGVDAARTRPYRFGADRRREGPRLLDPAERHPQPGAPGVDPEDIRTGTGWPCVSHGSRQSTGCAPWRSSSSFTRLNGREPKKPRSADMGEGCADSIAG